MQQKRVVGVARSGPRLEENGCRGAGRVIVGSETTAVTTPIMKMQPRNNWLYFYQARYLVNNTERKWKGNVWYGVG